MGRVVNVEGPGTGGEGMTFWIRIHHSLTQICCLQLITSIDGGKRSKPEDNIGMLEQLRAADPSAAFHFLEHLILRKRSDVRDGGWVASSEMLTTYTLGSAATCRVRELVP